MRKASLRWLKMKYRKKNIQSKMKTGYYSCFDGNKKKQNTFDMFVRKYADKWLGLFSVLHFRRPDALFVGGSCLQKQLIIYLCHFFYCQAIKLMKMLI